MAVSPYEGVGNESIMLKAQQRQQQEQSEMAMWAMIFQQMMNQVNAGQQNQYALQQLQEQGRQNILALRESNQLGMARDTHQNELQMKNQAFAYGLAKAAQDDLLQIKMAEQLAAQLSEGIAGPDLGADPNYEREIGELGFEASGYINAAVNIYTLPVTKAMQDAAGREMQEGVDQAMGSPGLSDVEAGRSFLSMGERATKRLEAHTTAEQTGARLSADFMENLVSKYGYQLMSGEVPSSTIDDELTLFITNTKQLAPYAGVFASSKLASETGDLPESTGKAVNSLVANSGGPLGLSFFRGFLDQVSHDVSTDKRINTSDTGASFSPVADSFKERSGWIKSFLQPNDNPSYFKGQAHAYTETNRQSADGRPIDLAPARAVVMSFLNTPEGRASFEESAKMSASQRGIQLDKIDIDNMIKKVSSSKDLAPGTFGALIAQNSAESAARLQEEGTDLNLQFRKDVASRYGRQRRIRAALDAQATYERMLASNSTSVSKSFFAESEKRLDALWKDLKVDPSNPESFQTLVTNLPEEVGGLHRQFYTNYQQRIEAEKDKNIEGLTKKLGGLMGQTAQPPQGPQGPQPGQAPTSQPAAQTTQPSGAPASPGSAPTVNLNFSPPGGGSGFQLPANLADFAGRAGPPMQLPERYQALQGGPQVPPGTPPLPANGVN